jgi:hypothetical protein
MRTATAAALAVVAAAFVACVTPPAPPAPRSGTEVNASFGKTWDAAIDLFAERTIQIKTLDRSSGLIIAEPQSVGSDGASLADCGSSMGVPLVATSATWNLLVRGDSAHTTAKATVRFVRFGTFGISTTQETRECSTKGTWETAFERDVKARAEAKK